MDIELGKPIAMDEGSRFAIREGGKTVGSGRVVEIIEEQAARRSAQDIRFRALGGPGK